MKKIVRNYIKQEVSDPEIQVDKKLFIETHFPRQGIWLRPSFVFVPALSTLIIALGIIVGPRLVSEPQLVPQTRTVQQAEAVLQDSSVYQVHPVDVIRASSRVGNVMVYQKLYKDNPMTIVWVFPTAGGSNAVR